MSGRCVVGLLLACTLAGCAGPGRSVPPPQAATTQAPSSAPLVLQKGSGAQWVQFAPHTTGDSYTAIVAGPDGNMWFLDELAHALVRISLDGSSKEFRLSSVLPNNAVSMTVGADKKFYIGDQSTSIVRVSTNGKAESFPIPSGDTTSLDGMALGPDGNVWFAEFDHIGNITPAGKITEFAYPSGIGPNTTGGVTAGSDGNVWFGLSSAQAIGKIVPSTGKITTFPITSGCEPAPLVLAKDGNVWFVCLSTTPKAGSITPSGTISTFSIGGTFGSNETEQFCSLGPDGEPWCASRNDANIFEIDTTTDTAQAVTPPLGSGVAPDSVAAGPDGNVWVDTVGGNEIDVLVLNPLTVTPRSLTFSTTGQTQTVSVSENGASSWTATSSNTSVATVAQGKPKSSFTVKSAGAGKCKITISDSVGNSVDLKVTVN